MSGFLTHVGIDDGDGLPVSLTTSEIHANSSGAVQGGLIATLLDTACGRRVADGLEEGQSTATVALNVTYLRPGEIGTTLTADASTLHRGDSLVMVEGEVRDEDGELVAHAAATFTVIDG